MLPSQAALAQAQAHHAGVLGLDVARQRGGVGMHVVDRADQPVDHVHVMAGLVEEGAAIQVPAAAPGRVVVVALRARPEHVHGAHENAPEAAGVYGLLQQLHRRVQAVLLHHEELHAGLAAGPHHLQAFVPLGGHGLLGQHVAAGRGHPHGLARVQAAGGGQGDDVGCVFAAGGVEQGVQRGITFHPGLGHRGGQRRGLVVAHRHQLRACAMLAQGFDVVGRDATAAHQREAHRALRDRQGAFYGCA